MFRLRFQWKAVLSEVSNVKLGLTAHRCPPAYCS